MRCLLCNCETSVTIPIANDSIYECTNCSLQFMPEIKSDDYYDDYFDKFRSNNSNLDDLRKKQYNIDAQHMSNFLVSGNILDVGCSTGEFLSHFLAKSDCNLFGIDLDKGAISKAKKLYGEKIHFSVGHLHNFSEVKKFDCIVFRGTFQYLGSNLRLTMEKIQKILTKNGKILIYVLPNSDSFLYYYLKEKWHLFNRTEHTIIFNKKSILELCKLYNFKLLEISYPYLDTVYANPKKDYQSLIDLINEKKLQSFTFWGNIMQVVMKKQ